VIAILQLKLNSLGVDGHFKKEALEGPIITLYKFVPSNSTRVSFIERLSDDMAVALGVEAVQVKRLPGEAAIGIYIPNKDRKLIQFRDQVGFVWSSYNNGEGKKIPLLFGIDHMGESIVEDLTLLPHLLVAGTTGSGKSTFLNSLLSALIYTVPSSRLKLVMSDVKQVEFTNFKGTPHLLYPVALSVKETLDQLQWVIDDVEARLGILAKYGCQNIKQFNERGKNMPYIVLVIDELAEILQDPTREPYTDEMGKEKLSKTYGKQAEHRLGLIAQKARATGIHIIAATQRPSVKVVEGNIKANFPARVSFKLISEADSRTILDTGGAEHLLSQGDMLYLSPNSPAIRRLHAPYATITDISAAIEAACQKDMLGGRV